MINIDIGDKINSWTAVSSPFLLKGKLAILMECKCGKQVTHNMSFVRRKNFSKSCRSCGQIDRRRSYGGSTYAIGDVLMNIEIMDVLSTKDQSRRYLVRCNNCNHVYKTGHSVLNRKANKKGTNSCRACFNSSLKKSKEQLFLTRDISSMAFDNIKRQADLRGIEFNLTAEYLQSIYDGRCALTGLNITIGTRSKHGGTHHLGDASLDRISSSIGYIQGNVQWIYKPINKMKYNLDEDEFIRICKLISNYHDVRKIKRIS